MEERVKQLQRWKENKAVQREKERREKERKGVFKTGLYHPKDTLVVFSQPPAPAKGKEVRQDWHIEAFQTTACQFCCQKMRACTSDQGKHGPSPQYQSHSLNEAAAAAAASAEGTGLLNIFKIPFQCSKPSISLVCLLLNLQKPLKMQEPNTLAFKGN